MAGNELGSDVKNSSLWLLVISPRVSHFRVKAWRKKISCDHSVMAFKWTLCQSRVAFIKFMNQFSIIHRYVRTFIAAPVVTDSSVTSCDVKSGHKPKPCSPCLSGRPWFGDPECCAHLVTPLSLLRVFCDQWNSHVFLSRLFKDAVSFETI
jgi:hypothetical protein